MKCFALIFITVASHQVFAHANILSLEAHEVGTGDAQISNWETDYGSYDRSFARSKKILVTLRNIFRKPAPFAITVYFIAKPTVQPREQGYDPRRLFIYDRGEHTGEFHNEIELSGAFHSRTLSANVQHYQTLGMESASGADEVAIAYGKTKLPAGLKLKVLSRSGATINALYLGDTVIIPADAAVSR